MDCPFCHTSPRGYAHLNRDACGLCNILRLKFPHIHYYCKCCNREYAVANNLLIHRFTEQSILTKLERLYGGQE